MISPKKKLILCAGIFTLKMNIIYIMVIMDKYQKPVKEIIK